MSPIWYEFFSLLLMGFLAVDTAITVSALTDFSRTIVNLQNNFNTYMDEVVEEVKAVSYTHLDVYKRKIKTIFNTWSTMQCFALAVNKFCVIPFF